MIRVAICGAGGRMGRTLVQGSTATPGMQLGAAIERPDSPFLGKDAGEVAGLAPTGVFVTDDVRAAAGAFDVCIDFTQPQAALAHIELCATLGKRVVVGTTGFSAEQKAAIRRCAERIAIVQAPNMSVGINLCFKLLETAAAVLKDDFDVEIVEAHHRHKRDAPSGTSLRMGEVVAAVLGRNLDECAVYGRRGLGLERDAKAIGFATVRGGDIVGEHTVMFAGEGETVEITHRAHSRQTFAKGALRAAVWVARQAPGIYDMQDVLGLRS
jgi:4-hydroxy-tetrahydrodipicolinate reductase